MNLMKAITYSTFTFASVAFAGDGDIQYNFSQRTIAINGAHIQDAAAKKSGLAAEIEARKDAVANFSEHGKKACPTDKIKFNGDRHGSLKSTGSELFPNSALRIKLVGNIKDIISAYPDKASPLPSTEEGKSFIFKAPVLSGVVVSCGTVAVQGKNRFSALLAPYKGPMEGVEVISLKLQGNVLVPDSTNDVVNIQKLAAEPEAFITLPIQ